MAWTGIDIRNHQVSDHLNLLRGLAALAVLLFHIRYLFFFDYHDVSQHDIVGRTFYFLTAFGHDAVVIFFVLSGFFIATSVVRSHAKGVWSWRDYAVSRLTRLYVVLLPALLLTVVWDSVGLAINPDSPIYTGEVRPWKHAFFSVADRLTGETLVGNVLFLQTTFVKPFGSNEALWSLAYEFWYYVLFPCACLAVIPSTALWKRFLYLAVVALIVTLASRNIVVYFPIWLLGAVVGFAPQISFVKRKHPYLATLTLLAAFSLALAFTHWGSFRRLFFNSVVAMDYITAVCFALLLYCLLHNVSISGKGRYTKWAGILSGFSYTLYLVHLPILVFCRALLVPDRPWEVNLNTIVVAIMIGIACVTFAWALSLVTEARTEAFREVVMRCFATRSTQREGV